MWQLISTSSREDGSAAAISTIRRRPSIARRLTARRDAIRADRLAEQSPTAERILAAIGPIAARHGMRPAHLDGDRVTWSTSADTAPRTQTVVNVSVDQATRSVDVDVDGHGLAEFITGRSHADGPITIRLAHDLDVALGHVALHLDRLCESVIITDR